MTDCTNKSELNRYIAGEMNYYQKCRTDNEQDNGNQSHKKVCLLGVLAYNIGPGAVNKSSVYTKLKRGDRNIYKEYVSHCHYKGKLHRLLNERRDMVYRLLFKP